MQVTENLKAVFFKLTLTEDLKKIGLEGKAMGNFLFARDLVRTVRRISMAVPQKTAPAVSSKHAVDVHSDEIGKAGVPSLEQLRKLAGELSEGRNGL